MLGLQFLQMRLELNNVIVDKPDRADHLRDFVLTVFFLKHRFLQFPAGILYKLPLCVQKLFCDLPRSFFLMHLSF